MHRLPADRAHLPHIDDHRVCEAIDGLPEDLAARAHRFALLGDPTRLAILLSVRAAGPIAVTDIALAIGAHDATVSQSLRLLRAEGAVSAERDGRVVRYSLADTTLSELLDLAVVGVPARTT